jgi:hypothetical protein
LSANLVGSLAKVGVSKSTFFVIIDIGNLKMRYILFVAELPNRFILNILKHLNLGPMALSLGLTTTKILGLMISFANSLLRGGPTFGLNFTNDS